MLEMMDDDFFLSGGTFHADGVEIRIDPFNENANGEPGEGGNAASNFILHVNQNDLAGLEGAERDVEAEWIVDETTMPMRGLLEIAVGLPDPIADPQDYTMGLHLYFNDNDDEDSTPDSKNAVLQPTPQLWSGKTGQRIGVDDTWSNTHYWTDVALVSVPTVHRVSSGGSIQAALDAAEVGDIVQIAPGVYTENLVVETPRVRLLGTQTGSDSTLIRPFDPLQPALHVSQEALAYGVAVEDLVLDGHQEGSGFAAAGIVASSRDARIRGNVVRGFSAPRAIVGSTGLPVPPEGAVVEDNLFFRNSGSVDFNRPNTLFWYNRVRIHSSGTAASSRRWTGTA